MKAAKLCEEQDQIGRRLSAASTKSSGRLLELVSNAKPRGMIVTQGLKLIALVLDTESGLRFA